MASNTSTPFNQISNIGLIAGPLAALSILFIFLVRVEFVPMNDHEKRNYFLGVYV